MALVSNKRAAKTDEPGDTYVKVMIWRDKKENWSYLNLLNLKDDYYQIVGGGSEAVRIFGSDQPVYVLPIINRDFTHLVTQ